MLDFVGLASCRNSKSYLVFFLINKEHEENEVIGGKNKEEN